MEAHLKISIGNQNLEVEGSEQFVEKIYSEYKHLLESHQRPPEAPRSDNNDSTAATRELVREAKKKSGKAPKGFKRLDIDLRPAGKTSLKDYVAGFANPTKDELYLLLINYFKETLGVVSITVDHVYTGLDELNQRIPTFLKQVLINTKNEKGWVDTSDFENLSVTTKGLNHLKHDIAKK